MNRYLILTSILIFTMGCINTQTKYDKKYFKVHLDENYHLNLNTGDVYVYDTLNNQVYYNLTFDVVRGGESYLLGFWKISETSGYMVKRLQVMQGNGEIISLSIDDLEKELNEFPVVNLNLLLND